MTFGSIVRLDLLLKLQAAFASARCSLQQKGPPLTMKLLGSIDAAGLQARVVTARSHHNLQKSSAA